MTSGRGRRWRLGLFVLGTGALFLALLTLVLDSTVRQDRATYFILFEENVKGMVVGSKVNFQGVPIGLVGDMLFQDGKTRVELRVDPSRAEIQEVTKARMDRLLVTGQVTIELEGFERGARLLPPGSLIATREDPLSSLRGSVPEVVDEATRVLQRLDRVLERTEGFLGEDNQRRVAGLLDELAATAKGLREHTLPAVDALLADARGLVGDARTAVGEAGATAQSLQGIEPRVREVAARAQAALDEFAAVTGGLRGPVQTTLASLRQALDDARALVHQLRLAPNSLLFGVERAAAPDGGGR